MKPCKACRKRDSRVRLREPYNPEPSNPEPSNPEPSFNPSMGLVGAKGLLGMMRCPRCETFYQAWVEEGDGSFVDYDEFHFRKMNAPTSRLLALLGSDVPDRGEIRRLLDDEDLYLVWALEATPRDVVERVLLSGLEDKLKAGTLPWQIVRLLEAKGVDTTSFVRQLAARLQQLSSNDYEAPAILASLRDMMNRNEDVSGHIPAVEHLYHRRSQGADILFRHYMGSGQIDLAQVIFAETPWSVFHLLKEGRYELEPFLDFVIDQALESEGIPGTKQAREREAMEVLGSWAMRTTNNSRRLVEALERRELDGHPRFGDLLSCLR